MRVRAGLTEAFWRPPFGGLQSCCNMAMSSDYELRCGGGGVELGRSVCHGTYLLGGLRAQYGPGHESD